jgi:hypothetical protein
MRNRFPFRRRRLSPALGINVYFWLLTSKAHITMHRFALLQARARARSHLLCCGGGGQVRFHPVQPNTLLTGSVDGTISVVDLTKLTADDVDDALDFSMCCFAVLCCFGGQLPYVVLCAFSADA